MLPVAFTSSYGYNSLFREGVIYNMNSLDDLFYILHTHSDLVVLNKYFIDFTYHVKRRLREIIFIKKHFSMRFLRMRELGDTLVRI
jgi:hypothetical protein|uniref:Uncharacterized protein n=1 Tax=viral metagenome TaxID=1070528 RepID=A0A6C0J9V6_9ZZZZ